MHFTCAKYQEVTQRQTSSWCTLGCSIDNLSWAGLWNLLYVHSGAVVYNGRWRDVFCVEFYLVLYDDLL